MWDQISWIRSDHLISWMCEPLELRTTTRYQLTYDTVNRSAVVQYVIFTAKCFPHKLKYLHTSRFHGAFSLDEISLKPVSLRQLIFVSKVNF